MKEKGRSGFVSLFFMLKLLQMETSRIKVGEVDVIFEDYEKNQGKIIITDSYGHNYSSYWGAMGKTIAQFVKSINHDYLATNLLGPRSSSVFCDKRTFKNLRSYIRVELCLNYWDHMEFQKYMRERINDFQKQCEELGQEYFIHSFESSFVDRLDFYLIEDDYDRKKLKSYFNDISEPWNMIEYKKSQEYKWIKNFHKELKKLI